MSWRASFSGFSCLDYSFSMTSGGRIYQSTEYMLLDLGINEEEKERQEESHSLVNFC